MNKKTIILIVLLIFVVGMIAGVSDVSASHTFKAGKYTGKITNKQYKQLKTAKKKGKSKSITVKTGKYKVKTKTRKISKVQVVSSKEYHGKSYYYEDTGWKVIDVVDFGGGEVYCTLEKVVVKKVKVRYPVMMNVQVYRGGGFVKFYLGGSGEILVSRNVRI